MKASLKARYEPDKAAAAAMVAVNVGDIMLRASMTDATVVNGPSMDGLALAVEKPGFFIVNYNVPKKDFRFQFMNTIRVSDKLLNLTYSHSRGDSANKVSANHVLGSGNGKLKYSYVHGGLTTFEPSYDFSKNSWDFAVSRRVYGDDVLRASFLTSNKHLGLEWSRDSKFNGSFKISASLNLADERKIPKLTAESTWDFEM